MNINRLKIYNNTDTVDIAESSIGLDTNLTGPERDNRGLHIQIKHNRNRDVLGKAYHLSHLLTAAPEMYRLLECILREQSSFGEHGDFVLISEIKSVLAKARGE